MPGQNLGDLNVAISADIAAFEAGINQVQSDLGKVAAAAEAAAGPVEKGAQRITDAQGRIRDGFGKFVTSAQLAAEAAANVGGSLGTLGDAAGRAGQSINQGLGGSFDAFDKALKPLDATIGRLGEGLKDVGGNLTKYITLPLGLLAGAAVSSAADLNALEQGFAATYKGAEPLADALAKVRDLAKLPGLGLREALEGATNLQAAGFSADQARKSLMAFGNALATVGKGKAELDRVSLALTQINNTPFVQGQDLNQLRQTLPQIGEALQKAFGTTSAEGLRALGVTSKQFIATVTDEFAKLPAVTGGLKNALENLSDAGTLALSSLGNELNKSFNLEGIADSINAAVKQVVAAFTSLSPATKQAIFVFTGIAAVAGPVIFGLGAVVAAIPPVLAGLEALGIASTAALGPIGLAIGAVAAGAALIITNWDSIVAYFSGSNGQVFADLAEGVKSAVGSIIDAVVALAKGPIGEAVAGLTKLTLAFDGKVLQGAVAIVTSALNIFAADIRIVTDLLSGEFSKALDDAAAGADAAGKPFQDLFGLRERSTTTFSDFFKDVLPAASTAAEGVDYFGDAVDKTAKKVVTLKDLQKELAAALQQRFTDAQAGKDTTADDANIARIRALIAEYKQLPGHVDAATKAIQKLRAELGALSVLDNVLAVPANGIDAVQRRIDTLNAGLKRLLEAGVSPASAAFKAFAAESLNLQQGLDKVLASTELASKPIDLKLKVTVGDFNPDEIGKFSQELLNHPVLVPFRVVPTKVDFSSEILNQQIAIQNGFAKVSLSAAAFGTSFDYLGARTEVLREALQNLVDQGVSPLDPAFKKLSASLQEAQEQEDLNRIVAESLKGALIGIGEALGNSLATGANAFKAVLGALLSALGDFAIKYGTVYVTKGVLDVFGGNVGQGVAEIAGGTALIAAGSAVKSYGSAATSSAGGGSVSAPSTSYTSSASGSTGNGVAKVEVVGELKGRGSELVAVLRASDYRVLRTG